MWIRAADGARGQRTACGRVADGDSVAACQDDPNVAVAQLAQHARALQRPGVVTSAGGVKRWRP